MGECEIEKEGGILRETESKSEKDTQRVRE